MTPSQAVKKFNGKEVKDKYSGLAGFCTGVLICVNGCIQVGIQGKQKDGRVPDAYWADSQQVEVMPKAKLMRRAKVARKKRAVGHTGGPSGYKGSPTGGY